jgi:phosphoglycolate phosphatase-like HAD superfamily hydrolase
MVRLVLFDIDGTLIRTGGAGVQAFDRTFEEVFGLKDTAKSLKFSGRTDVSLVREGLKKHGIEPSESNFQKFFATYPLHLEQFLKVLPGAVLPGILPLIQQLYACENRPVIGLLTGNVRRGAELKLGHYGLWDRFETGAFADDNEDRNCIASVAKVRGEEMLGQKLDGSEVVVIGDTPLDIACGNSIGAKVLAVATGIHSRAELLAEHPAWAVETVSEVGLSELLA